MGWPFWLKPFSLELSVFVDTGFGVAIRATVFLMCVSVAIPGSRKISGQEWLAMVSKRREGVRGSRGQNEQKEWTCKFCSGSILRLFL